MYWSLWPALSVKGQQHRAMLDMEYSCRLCYELQRTILRLRGKALKYFSTDGRYTQKDVVR